MSNAAPARDTPPSPGGFPAAHALAVFGVALAVRGVWCAFVQAPQDDVVSDMAGYIARARAVLDGVDAETCFPPGAHWFYAGELLLVGPGGLAAAGLLNAVCGAVVAPMAGALASECLPGRRAGLAVGLVVAAWYPLVALGGFFLSEVPFAPLAVGSVWLWARAVRTGRGWGIAGVAAGLGWLTRPPILLGVLLLVAWTWALGRSGALGGARQVAGREIARWVLPIVLAVTLGAARYRAVTGQWGLIADNGAVASFFAFTDYSGLTATPPRGAPKPAQRSFHPPSRADRGAFTSEFTFVGGRCEPGPLLAERDRVIAVSGPGVLMRRVARNVGLLASGNRLWPERHFAKRGVRRRVLSAWPWLTGCTIGLAAVGAVATARAPRTRERAITLGLLAPLLAVVVAAAGWGGEVRYRVPYDPLLIVLAAVGVVAVYDLARGARRARRG